MNAKKPTRLEMKDAIVVAASPHVAFDGWGEEALAQGAVVAGYDADTAKRLFPEGAVDAIAHFANLADREMVNQLATQNIDNMRVRDRVIAGVQARLEFLGPHREAVRSGLAVLSKPHHAVLLAQLTSTTVDEIWTLAGDRSADFNWYTKRGSLAAVYGATVLYWLADDSEGHRETWDFLARRVDDVLKLFQLRSQASKALADIPKSLGDLVRGFEGPRTGTRA